MIKRVCFFVYGLKFLFAFFKLGYFYLPLFCFFFNKLFLVNILFPSLQCFEILQIKSTSSF